MEEWQYAKDRNQRVHPQGIRGDFHTENKVVGNQNLVWVCATKTNKWAD